MPETHRRTLLARPRYVISRLRMRPDTCERPVRSLAALLRLAWYGLVVGYCGERCFDCGRPYGDFIWIAGDEPDGDLWRRVTGWTAGGLLCPRCFAERARRKGIGLTWHTSEHF